MILIVYLNIIQRYYHIFCNRQLCILYNYLEYFHIPHIYLNINCMNYL